MIPQIAFASLVGLVGYAYLALRPPSPRICGSPGGPPLTSPRVKLDNGRHLAYKERGVPKEEAKHKIIVSHAYGDSKDFKLPISDELLKELQIYIVAFDRAGYGESDPNPMRSVKTDAYDIQGLADKLQLGPKFYVFGISQGAYAAYGCLKYFPQRLSGAALVVPLTNYWWPCFPAKLSKDALSGLHIKQQWTFSVAHYAPWLLNWWMTQKLLPSISTLELNSDIFCPSDLQILEQSEGVPKEDQGKVLQQGVHESLHQDLIVGFGKWEFDPTDINNPFPNNEGRVHIWQGYEDKVFWFELNRYISRQLPWIRYHEVAGAGHLLIYNATHCEAIFRALVSS